MEKVTNINKNFVKDVSDFDVYKIAYSSSLEIHKKSLGFPKIEQFALGDQLRRSTKSICANLAEGFAKQKFSTAEFRRFVSLSAGSAGEVKVWLKYCLDLGYIDTEEYKKWRDEYTRISMMLQKLGKSLGN